MPTRPLSSALVIEEESAHRARPLTHLSFFLASLNSGGVKIDDKDGHAAMPRIRVRTRKDKPNICNRCVVYPDLAAIQLPSLAVTPCLRSDSLDIRSGFGFRNAVGDQGLSRQYVRQPFLALGNRAMARQQRPDQLHETALIRNGRVASREFLHDQRIRKRVEFCTAIDLGNRDPEQAALSHFEIDFTGKPLRFIQLAGYWTNSILSKIPCRFLRLNVSFGQIHGQLLVTI